MGVYLKVWHIEISGTPILGFGYVWSQTEVGGEGFPPIDNNSPYKPNEPIGRRVVTPGQESFYSAILN